MKINSSHLKQMIAEAAYFRSERRNFEPGYAMQDWLEAEQTITASLKSAKRLIATPKPIEVPATTSHRKTPAKKLVTAKVTAKRVVAGSPAADSSSN